MTRPIPPASGRAPLRPPRRPSLPLVLALALMVFAPAALGAPGAPPPAQTEEAEPRDGAPTDEGDAELSVAVEDGELVATRGGEVIWSSPVPPLGGPTSTLLPSDDRVLLAHGLYLLEIDAETGTVAERHPLPAPAAEVTAGTGDAATVELVYASGITETRSVPARDDAPVRFDVEPAAFGWLRAGAASTERPEEALTRDPANPWLALEAAGEADGERRDELLDRAVAAATELPFFEAAGVARHLAREGERERADEAMDAALRDFAARDYDPRLLTDLELRDAYGFPLAAVEDALRRGDADEAEFWAPYAWRLAAEEAPATVRGLEELADALRDAGRPDAADLWRGRAADLRRAGLATWLDRVALELGRFGWNGVAALLAGFVLAWIVLLAKVWRAQSLARNQRRERAEPTRPWTRLWVPRQASTTEKIALVMILVLAGLQAGLAAWADRAEADARALGSGTLASLPGREALAQLPDTPRAHFARGVSAHVRGSEQEARASYEAAGEHAPALTNLGVLTGDETRFTAALRVDPREPVARYHLGRAGNPSPFHEVYGGTDPLLAVPSPLAFALGSAGDWRGALRDTAARPWATLPEARPEGVSIVLWWVILIAYALLLVALVLQVFVPRPRVARHAPRTPAYHPLALLIPGSGHLDELWGLLLVVPWSLIGFDALRQLLGMEGGLGLSLATEAWLLGVFWFANLVGFSVEAASYRRRIRLLREEKPELARSYGLPPRPVKTET